MKHLLTAILTILTAFATDAEPIDLFPGTDTIPILSWFCIQPNELSVERYRELKECGFNLSFPSMTTDFKDAVKALDCAAAANPFGRLLSPRRTARIRCRRSRNLSSRCTAT